MCTLIIGREVLGPRTVLLAANRDEDPARPTDPPGVLQESPQVVGGRDRVAGGTWLALREGRAAVALLNRRDPGSARGRTGPRSRGLLTVEVAAVEDRQAGLSAAALHRAMASLRENLYAPLTLVFAAPDACWVVSWEAEAGSSTVEVSPGWHVVTHSDLDDPAEPRTAHLLRGLSGWRPGSLAAAEERLGEWMRSHGEAGTPPVCLHQGRMVTVSSSLVALDDHGARYLHAEGRPCEHPYLDQSPLLARAAAKRSSA